MRILKLHHPTGHPYWNRNEYSVQMPDGSFIDCYTHSRYPRSYGVAYEISVDNDGIHVQYFHCSSGCGRVPGEKHLLVSKSEYDSIEYIGKPLTMSQELIDDLRENE